MFFSGALEFSASVLAIIFGALRLRLRLIALVVMVSCILTTTAPAGELNLRARSQVNIGSAEQPNYAVQTETLTWEAQETAIVVCDMWDNHWCVGATQRVTEMAPHMNQVISRARSQGMLIIHCPSSVVDYYKQTSMRRLAQQAPVVETTIPLKDWCHIDPSREPPLPIDDSDGGCDCQPTCKTRKAWTRQIDSIEIQEGDAICDDAQAYFLMKQRGIRNVIVMGVHLNMCVLGRPFSIRQMVYQGQNVVLMRDLSDTMYNHRSSPYVDHFDANRLVTMHIERHWCPTITSTEITGQPAFQFAADHGSDVAMDKYDFDKAISRDVLENYLARSITMEGLLNGRGNFEDNVRMLKSIGAKFVGRSLCLWGGEANLLRNLERAREQIPLVQAADPEMILQACIFEIVTTQVDQVPVPDWVFTALNQPVEKRNFRYADMLYPSGRFKDHWRTGESVPDVSRMETKLWFYFLGVSYIDVGCEAIHFGQTELMNGNDPNLDHYWRVLQLLRDYASQHARRHMLLCDCHVPSGGLVREGQLLMDFHSFPLRIKEVPNKPQEAILEIGFTDSIYGRSKGGMTISGWQCEHLPYLVEIDNWGVSQQPGQAGAGSVWVWGYDEITWFAHQSQPYRSEWLRYAWDWVRRIDPNGFLQMPGSRTLRSPLDDLDWYYANRPSKNVPKGFDDEQAIRSIWMNDSGSLPEG